MHVGNKILDEGSTKQKKNKENKSWIKAKRGEVKIFSRLDEMMNMICSICCFLNKNKTTAMEGKKTRYFLTFVVLKISHIVVIFSLWGFFLAHRCWCTFSFYLGIRLILDFFVPFVWLWHSPSSYVCVCVYMWMRSRFGYA